VAVVTPELSRDGPRLRGVTTWMQLEITPMALIDCPLCDAATPFDEAAATLDCDACRVRLELAPDPEAALPAAA
jgi:hypothetical protein